MMKIFEGSKGLITYWNAYAIIQFYQTKPFFYKFLESELITHSRAIFSRF